MSNTKPRSASERIAEFRDWYELARDGNEPQLLRETEDLQFQVAELQWTEEARQARQGVSGGALASPPRPMLSVDKIAQPMRLVMNAARSAKLGVSVHPVSEHATDETATVYEGLYSRIQRDSDANKARMWALDRAVKAGRGWYRIDVRPDEDSFDQLDLEIRIVRILHQGAVLPDPTAQEPDYSDGEFLFVPQWLQIDKFKREYKNAPIPDAGDRLSWEDVQSTAPLWVRGEGKAKAVLVAECFYKEHEEETVYLLNNGTRVRIRANDKDPRRPEARDIGSRRTRDIVTVKWVKLSAFDDVLDQEKWMGSYIPFVPVLGRELQPFDEHRRVEGVIRPARDAQRFFNMSLSNTAQQISSEPLAPWVMPDGMDEGHQAEWQLANVKGLAVLHYKPVAVLTDDGRVAGVAPPPQRAQHDPTRTSIALMGVNLANELLQSSTATYDPSLGKTANQHESGRKVLALQSQADMASSDFVQEGLMTALRLEARIVMDLIPKVYDARGRITMILGGEDQKPQKVMLNQPFVHDQDTGRPMAAADGAEGAKHYDLAGGRYSIAPTIGQSNETRLEAGGEALSSLLEKEPALVPVLGPTWARFQTWPGHEEVADILTRLRDQTNPGLGDPKSQDAKATAAKAQALEQQVQMLTQQLQQAGKALETEAAKHAATVQIETMKAQTQAQTETMKQQSAIAIAQINNAAKVEVARLTSKYQSFDAAAAAAEEHLSTGLTLAHEADQAEKDRAHEVAMAAVGAAHAKDAAAMAGAQDAEAQAADQQHQAGMAEQAQGHDAAQADADRQAAADAAAQQQAGGAE